MPLAMVVGRLFVTTAMMVATAPALHSLGPPENSETATRDTIRHPGNARNPRAHAPSLGICCPIRTPESRITNVPTVRARITDRVSVTADRTGHSGTSDAAEYQRPGRRDTNKPNQGSNDKDRCQPRNKIDAVLPQRSRNRDESGRERE